MKLKRNRDNHYFSNSKPLVSSKSMVLIIGASLLEVLVAILLVGVSLGAVFKLNNAAIDEMRALKEHHYIQAIMNNLVVTSRIHYDHNFEIAGKEILDEQIKNIYSVSGDTIAYPDSLCVQTCTYPQSAENDVRLWTQGLKNRVSSFEYNIAVTDNDVIQISVAWQGTAQQASIDPECAIDITGSRTSCLFLSAYFGE